MALPSARAASDSQSPRFFVPHRTDGLLAGLAGGFWRGKGCESPQPPRLPKLVLALQPVATRSQADRSAGSSRPDPVARPGEAV